MAKPGEKRKKSENRVKIQGALTGVAVAAAIAGFGYAWVASTTAADQVAQATAGAQPVVVAAANIEAGTKITPEMLTTQEIPAAFCSDSVVKDASAIVGKTAVVDVAAGSQVSASSFTGSEAKSLADALPEGKVAYTVGVDAESGVAANVHQGDYVDIITRDADARYVLRNIRVIALDSSLAETSDKGYSTIPLELTSEEVAQLQSTQAETSTRFVLASTADNAKEVAADGADSEQAGGQEGQEEAR